MDDPNIIATLVATKTDLVRRAFSHKHNEDRYLPPNSDPAPTRFSRENTPYAEDHPDDKDVSEHRLELTFDKPPKNVDDGFVFGCSPDCDVQLADWEDLRSGDWEKVQWASRRQFSITFDAQRRVILRDVSTNGTSVSYDGQAQNDIRDHFTWIIFPDFETIEVSIPRAEISFRIKLGKHENRDEEFFANVDAMFPPSVRMREGGLASPMLQLNVHSRDTTVAPSGTASPRHGPIYLLHETVGKGSFGKVYRAVDVSTGNVYASKFFLQSECKREVAIMRKVKHKHIVCFIDSREGPTPFLVMEYLPLGNLADAHAASPIAFEETLSILSQALPALEYLHFHGFIHRDIKPANILLSCRDPIAIKLADLGLAKHNPNGSTKFKTALGTHRYAAPEIYESKKKPYTYAVDIWSLGIVALELAYGLPEAKADGFSPKGWFRKVFKFVQALDSDQLIDFLSGSMLRPRPENRLSASECLEKVLSIEKAFRTQPTREVSPTEPGTRTEKASLLTTVMWVSNDGSKRQRSPGSSFQPEFSKRTVVRKERDDQSASLCSETYAIANASLFFLGPHGSMYQSVLKLLKNMQVDKDEVIDSDTSALVRALCQQLEQLEIAEIIKSTDRDAGRTILTAVTETRKFPLASLTSSDLANSVADLARHLSQMMDLVGPHPKTPRHGHVSSHSHEKDEKTARSSYIEEVLRETDPVEDKTPDGARTPTKASPFPEVENSRRWSRENTNSWQTSPSRGLTYPSAMLDVLNVPGCNSEVGID